MTGTASRAGHAPVTTRKPTLSVIMPVHEGAEWIGATLSSLANETADDLEVIILDSSPTPDTAAIVNRYANLLPIRMMHRPDIVAWQSKTNLGVESATADYACMLHQDDLWLRGRMDAVRRWIGSDSQADLHLAPTAIIDREGRRLGTWNCPLPSEKALEPEFLLERLVVQNFVSVPAPVFRRSAWLATEGMDAALWYTADWDLWFQLASTGRTIYHRDVTTAFRVHGSSLTVKGSRDGQDFRSQMELVLSRHVSRLPTTIRTQVEPAAKASISMNVSLASASNGNLSQLPSAIGQVLSLGPSGIRRYLRDSRLGERVGSRLRAKLAGAF